MSKSEGNFVTIHELLHTKRFGQLPWTGDAVRLAMLTVHYAKPIDWTVERLATASANLHTFKLTVAKGLGVNDSLNPGSIAEFQQAAPSAQLLDCLSDDINTPKAIFEHLFFLVKAADQVGGVLREPAKVLMQDCLFLGIDPFRHARAELAAFDEQKGNIDLAIDDRLVFIAAKNFVEADRIRDELLAQGIQLKDSKDSTTGERVTTWEVKR